MIHGDVIPYNRIKKRKLQSQSIYIYPKIMCFKKCGAWFCFYFSMRHSSFETLSNQEQMTGIANTKSVSQSVISLCPPTQKSQPRTDSSWQGRVRPTHSQGGLGADHRLILPIKCLTLETLARVTNRVDIPETIPSPNGVAIQYLGTARLLYIICPG